MRRWREDVVLVEEEMRRTIEYGFWSALEWGKRGTARKEVSSELTEGLMAYAQEQQDRELRTCTWLTEKWAPIREWGCIYLAGEAVSGADVVVPLEEDDVAGDEEDGQPDYGDEGDDEILD